MKIATLIKIVVVIFGIWFCRIPAEAQTTFSRTYGGSDADSIVSMESTPDGGYVLGGSTHSFGAATSDFWVIKLDSSAAVEWERRFGGSDEDTLSAVHRTQDGGYIAMGTANSFGTGDIWIVKLDSLGAIQWQKAYSGIASGELGSSIQNTTDGGFIVAGATSSSDPNGDWLLLKLDATGDLQWGKTYGLGGTDIANDVRQTSDGGYIAAGYTTNALASEDGWIIKLDSTGAIQWEKSYNGGIMDILLGVHETSDNGYIANGITNSTGDFDAWVMKLDSAGVEEWSNIYRGFGNEIPSTVIESSAGGFIVSGSTSTFPAAGFDGWLRRLDASGSTVWEKIYGSAGADSLGPIEETAAGFVAAGGTDLGSAGDAWLVNVDANGDLDASCLLASDFVLPEFAQIFTPTTTAASVADASPAPATTTEFAVNTTSVSAVQCPPPTCDFCDEFEDGILASDWTYVKGTWVESGGALTIGASKKSIALATPAFSGCSGCEVSVTMQTGGGTGNRVWLLAWYTDKANRVELMMKQQSNKWMLKQFAAGHLVGKSKFISEILPNTEYAVSVLYDGADFHVTLNGAPAFSMTAGAPPSGTLGFEAKATQATFGYARVVIN